jgi:hypothetical protein
LARYKLMHMLEDLCDQCGRPGYPPGLWLLIPMATKGLPAVDGVPVPIITSSQWSHVPQAWLENLHRAGLASDGIPNYLARVAQ